MGGDAWRTADYKYNYFILLGSETYQEPDDQVCVVLKSLCSFSVFPYSTKAAFSFWPSPPFCKIHLHFPIEHKLSLFQGTFVSDQNRPGLHAQNTD